MSPRTSHLGFVLLLAALGGASSSDLADEAFTKLRQTFDAMSQALGALSRQVMLQQFEVQEKIRSDADSGVKQIRDFNTGTRNYHTATHTRTGSVLAIHDHSNNDRTVGMGEFVGVLNGVEFRTRHNDYRLYMPHRTSKEWHATENIPFPQVPPSVLNKPTISEQIEEMKEWFKAWRDQNHTVRDYRDYFKPVLCYLEGAWTTNTENIEEPFESDRHFVDASSWFDLQEKIRFTSYTGRKDNLENFSFLPTAIINVTKDGRPIFAQWNYRILCHPVSRDIPLNRFRVVDDLGVRLTVKRSYEHHGKTRSARFQLNPFDKDWQETEDKINQERWGLLDEIMSEIPGKDNYAGSLTDEAFDIEALSMHPEKNGEKLDVSRYHRWFKVGRRGAMGTSIRSRGFSDDTLYMAMTSQPKVAGMNLAHQCWTRWNGQKMCKHYYKQKWTYAIPLEIIFLTPLHRWNPYDIQYKGDAKTDWGKTVVDGGRNGDKTPEKAYNGSNSRVYYQTPVEMFQGGEVGSGAADTTKSSVGVLDKTGKVRNCVASGTRVFFPYMPGVGFLRQRYPIFPVHGEGSLAMKELEAVKDLLLKSGTYGYAFRETLGTGTTPPPEPEQGVTLQMKTSRSNSVPWHEHTVTLEPHEVEFLKNSRGSTLIKTTTESAGHMHEVKIMFNTWNNINRWEMTQCDSVNDPAWNKCNDQHPSDFVVIPEGIL
ncbi:uncharacterized protein LOC5517255 [Nematostella vectensis]|uniref:uncharacterized protein LOC5517255 n=1 Tax=Nematostella vectensis TaxID=45351 RepID=UPI00138FE08C|nr:uncharacterized protein LOC5517255 [Nematostella vectensis]XP_032243226.1 uncharacterized protein LOC5517255 [Nematostella vectensis]XP_048588396.1 uncharacterized protein LOC5517255 [Nematostella vectensis]XP_048588397.1 uncharacterized protein LOC5517255 [Nematostella vectensis]